MSIPIKEIPILSGKDAKVFTEKVKNASLKKGSVDFSKEVYSANRILKKAGMK